ncbi:hypothetical protein FACS189440_15410 [Bacteroidia bacterium]|nr:hypothetical protein FACS189423_02310 [Bacteroidia bacterium]GHT49521.1 hypothetical protein FACS189440_15410 [Bacteroidia bacterium]
MLFYYPQWNFLYPKWIYIYRDCYTRNEYFCTATFWIEKKVSESPLSVAKNEEKFDFNAAAFNRSSKYDRSGITV